MHLKKLLLLGMIAAASTSQAQVFLNGPFGTPPFWIESWDTLTPGGTNSVSIFTGWATANRIGTTGQLWIGPPPVWHHTPPNAMYGRAVDVEIVAAIPMRRFGGRFARMVPGMVQATQAIFRFFDNS